MENDLSKDEMVEEFKKRLEEAKQKHDGDGGVANMIAMNLRHLGTFDKSQEQELNESIKDLYDALDDIADDRQQLIDKLQDALQNW